VAYVLDTSAVLAVLKAEPGYEKVAEILAEAESDAGQDLLLPFMAVMETQYRLLRDLPQEEVLAAVRLVEAWPVTVMESTPSWRQRAAEVKNRGGLSAADAWIVSLALLHDAELVHKDPEFDSVEGLRSYRLPD
jgi:predicted nucleic acid-binding protein